MRECLLCTRDMSKSQKLFGNSCLKKAYKLLNLPMPRTNKEEFLYNKVMEQKKKVDLNIEQKEMLLDRCLTLNILNTLPKNLYKSERENLVIDINSINKNTNKKELKSFNLITLKQSLDIKKYYKKYEDVFNKIMNGEYDALQEISFEVVRFAFSKYYNKKQYLYDGIQTLQYGILKMEVVALNSMKMNLSAQLLNHSLEKNSEDLVIIEEKYVNKIKNDKIFKNKINEILKKYTEDDFFDTGIGNETLIFEKYKDNLINSTDLFGAIHNCNIQVVGKKNKNLNWDLNIIITDRYDFTELQKIQKYIENDFINKMAVISNNIAMLATSCNVVHEYNVTIKFSIENWK